MEWLIKCRNCDNQWEYIKYSPSKKVCSPECRYRTKYGRELNHHTHILPRLNRHQLRAIVLDHYGRKCVYCKRTGKRFCIDHVFEDGPDERIKLSEAKIFRKIIMLGFPSSYQILCYKCNIAKSYGDAKVTIVRGVTL